MKHGIDLFKKYKGWEDDVVRMIPHETYVKLSKLKGVEFYGTPFFMSYFIPRQDGSVLPEEFWEAHWEGKGPALHCYHSAKKSLEEFFKIHYNAKLVGITPCTDKKAVKMARLLGFWPTGQFLMLEGTCYILSIKKKEK